MNLRQMAGLGQTTPSAVVEAAPLTFDRGLALIVEGATQYMPAADAEDHQKFRAMVCEMASQVPERLPIDAKLAQIGTIVSEFEGYCKSINAVFRDRQIAWRTLSSALLRELLVKLGVEISSPSALPLIDKIGGLSTREDIQAYRNQLEEFLHPGGVRDTMPEGASPLKVEDRTTANNNAAGLRGGGSAVEQLKGIMERHSKAFVVLFGLGCLDVISERFGMEAVEDCLMTVSAFLTANLHRDDVIYHWSDSTLLAILEGRPNEQILTAELRRIASQNREITIQIGDRTVMLRIPLDFVITPTARLRTPDDLYKLSVEHTTQW
jgi:GGDEF domain-containing protein